MEEPTYSCTCSTCNDYITASTRHALDVEVQAHYEIHHFNEFTELERAVVDGASALDTKYVYGVEN